MTAPDPAPTAIAGLSREVEALRRAMDALRPLQGRVDELTSIVARLSEATATAHRPADRPGAASWLMLPASADAATVLADLSGWVAAVYLRYPDGVQALPACWLWHPDVIEELLWLMHAWRDAYDSDRASVAAAGDWHDRQRPGAVRRIRAAAGACSPEGHLPGGDRYAPAAEPPLLGAAGRIADWWAADRDGIPPCPAENDLAEQPGSRT